MTIIMDSLLRGSLVWYAPSIHFKRRHCLSLKSHMRILTTLGLLKPEVNSRIQESLLLNMPHLVYFPCHLLAASNSVLF